MPHDANGELIKVGDEVIMRFNVHTVRAGDNDYNVKIVAIDVASTGQTYLPTVLCNSKLVIRDEI